MPPVAQRESDVVDGVDVEQCAVIAVEARGHTWCAGARRGATLDAASRADSMMMTGTLQRSTPCGPLLANRDGRNLAGQLPIGKKRHAKEPTGESRAVRLTQFDACELHCRGHKQRAVIG